MFNIEQARLYCKEDFSLIENYEQANKDLLEIWDLHHRKENEGFSRQELIDSGSYYKRPASELIFITHAEHTSLHKKGEKNPWYGKYLSDEHRKKMSEAQKGIPKSEETRRKMSEAQKGKTGEKCHNSKPVQQIDKKTGQVIKTWPCTAEVERVLGIAHPNISACCLGKLKSAGGYVWRYK